MLLFFKSMYHISYIFNNKVLIFIFPKFPNLVSNKNTKFSDLLFWSLKQFDAIFSPHMHVKSRGGNRICVDASLYVYSKLHKCNFCLDFVCKFGLAFICQCVCECVGMYVCVCFL